MTIERAIEILNPEHREHYDSIETVNEACQMGMKALEKMRWIPVEERLPENNRKKGRAGDALCYVPPRDGCFQNGVYLGRLEHIAADDGSGNFWNLKTPASDWTLWEWSYFEQPVVTHWMPLPEPPGVE